MERYDVVVVGGGHNGLTAAAYLAREGLRVLVLERLDHTGGAAVSAEVFPGTGVRLSRYSYLVSLLPEQVAHDLGLDIELRSRRTASYTPVHRDHRDLALLAERPEGHATEGSFWTLTGSDRAYEEWQRFYEQMAGFAEVVAPTLTQPLPLARDLARQVDPELWRGVVDEPLDVLLRRRFADDTVRGVVATDALIGTFASMDSGSLAQNRCFLYHLIGNGTGEWRVPVGGMGSVTAALDDAARTAGAEIRTGAGVSAVRPTSDGAEVTFHDGSWHHTVRAGTVLANTAPWVLRILLGEHPGPRTRPSGSQLKVNLLLSRLPRLRSGDDPEVAFAGTFHVAEGYEELQLAYDEAAGGAIPSRPPGEMYCHSLTDPSILGPLAGTGAQTLTWFGLHMPAQLFEDDREAARTEALRRTVASMEEYLAEPLLDCVLTGPDGEPCVEVKVPQDVEADLAMPGGHIFHGDLSWPWASDREALDSPARRWGVDTGVDHVLLCGSGARRGGAVSGLGGHNAAMAVLEARGA